MTSEDRLQTHRKQPHKIECQQCPRRFISMAHLQFHLESYHRTTCGDCLGLCGSRCTIYIAKKLELENKRMFDAGIIEKTEAAKAASEDLEIFVRKQVSLSSQLAQDMGRLLDLGFEGPEALPWSRLLYLPTAKYPERAFSPEVKEWIRLTILEMALIDHKIRIRDAGVIECLNTKRESSMANHWQHQWLNHPDPSDLHWNKETSIIRDEYALTRIDPI